MTDPEIDSVSPDPYEGENDFTVESLDGRAHLQDVHGPAWLRRRRLGITVVTMLLVSACLLWATGLAEQWWQ